MKKINEKQLQNFTYNMKFIRESNSLSKKEMAKILNISIYSLNKLEKGNIPKNLPVDIIFAVMHHFKISPAQLFGEKLD